MSKTYTTSTDLIAQEIMPILDEAPAVRDLPAEQYDTLAHRVYELLDAAGLIKWADGWNGEAYWLPDQGFELVLDDDLNGSDFWDCVITALDEIQK